MAKMQLRTLDCHQLDSIEAHLPVKRASADPFDNMVVGGCTGSGDNQRRKQRQTAQNTITVEDFSDR